MIEHLVLYPSLHGVHPMGDKKDLPFATAQGVEKEEAGNSYVAN
jgi:hypothetical protein